MNNRIDDLIMQATVKEETYPAGCNGYPDYIYDFDKQKFAKLIVKEICDIMEQTEDDLYSLEPAERPTEYIEWLYDLRTNIENHFGVD